MPYEFITATGIEIKGEPSQKPFVQTFINTTPTVKPVQPLFTKHKMAAPSTRLNNPPFKKNRCLLKNKYQTAIKRISHFYGVDKNLVTAVIAAESCFSPKIVSPKGAEGLMQLMPFTAKRFGVINSFDPMQNITGGVKYLKFLLGYFKGKTHLAVAAYNAGEGAVNRYKGIPPYKETKNYVKKVLAMLENRSAAYPTPIKKAYADTSALKVKRVTFSRKSHSNKVKLLSVEPQLNHNCIANTRLRQYTYEEVQGRLIKRYYLPRKGELLDSIAKKLGVSTQRLKNIKKDDKTHYSRVTLTPILVWSCHW